MARGKSSAGHRTRDRLQRPSGHLSRAPGETAGNGTQRAKRHKTPKSDFFHGRRMEQTSPESSDPAVELEDLTGCVGEILVQRT